MWCRKRLKIFYEYFVRILEYRWSKDECIECCTRKERNGIAWFKEGVWKSRGIVRG
jgi:hypothetical protein